MYKAKRALNNCYLKIGPQTHTRTHKSPKRKMDLPASCGLRRPGSAGLEPAAHCRCKHRVGGQRRAPVRSSYMRLAQSQRRDESQKTSSDTRPEDTRPDDQKTRNTAPSRLFLLAPRRGGGNVSHPSAHLIRQGNMSSLHDWSGCLDSPPPEEALLLLEPALCPLADLQPPPSHSPDWARDVRSS